MQCLSLENEDHQCTSSLDFRHSFSLILWPQELLVYTFHRYMIKLLSIYLSHSFGDHWGTTRPGNQHSPFLSFLCSPHGVAQLQTRPIPDVIFPSFSLSAPPSPSLYSALENCLGKSRSSCDMPIPLHFASFYSGQEFFVGSDGFPNPASHLFVGAVVFVRDAKETSETSHWFPLSVSFSLFLLLMSKSHKNIKIWTWPGSATVWSLSWGLCSCRPRWSWALWVLLWSGQSWSVFQAWILRQWRWLPNIWSFGRFSASRHWPWYYCWCHWCCWSSIWSSQYWSACRMR